METNTWIEVPIFIHGVTPAPDPKSHEPEYKSLNSLIEQEFDAWNRRNRRRKLDRQLDKKFDLPLIPVEWGWLSPNGGEPQEDAYLARAEQVLVAAVSRSENGSSDFDFTINPLRAFRSVVRAVIFQGFADLFYYASRDGEVIIRDHVFSQIGAAILKLGKESKASLTLITHSAGTLIAHDLLYQLFRSDEIMKVKEEAGEPSHPAIRELREMVFGGRLRIRRFYTMGSPIAALVMRSDGLIRKMLRNERLQAKDIGLKDHPELRGRRWVNFWDRDDFASYPLNFLYEDGVVEDRYVDVGDTVLLNPTHNRYWYSQPLAAYISDNW